MHANTWIKSLGNGSQESIARLQTALEQALPFALGIFEPSPFEQDLVQDKVFEGESSLRERWIQEISKVIETTALQLPDLKHIKPEFGGRKGVHTAHLQPLLEEMSEVFKLDPTAEW